MFAACFFFFFVMGRVVIIVSTEAVVVVLAARGPVYSRSKYEGDHSLLSGEPHHDVLGVSYLLL